MNSVSWIHCELSMDSHNLQQVQVSAVQTIDKNIFNLCHCNYMLKVSFSPLLMSESWEKPVLFSEHQRCSVGSCEVMCDSYNPMVVKREWGKHPIPHWWAIHGAGLCFTEANVWEGNMELIMAVLDVGDSLDLWLLCLSSGMLNSSHIGTTRSNHPFLLFFIFLLLEPGFWMYICAHLQQRCFELQPFRQLCQEPDYSLNAGVDVHFILMDFNILTRSPRNYSNLFLGARCFCFLHITLLWGPCVVGEGSCFEHHIFLLVEGVGALCRHWGAVLWVRSPVPHTK